MSLHLLLNGFVVYILFFYLKYDHLLFDFVLKKYFEFEFEFEFELFYRMK